jgi:3-oxoacyl-[acyl-carrier protein] reductase
MCEEKPIDAALVIANFHRNAERARHLHECTGCTLRRADLSDEQQVESLFAELPPLWAVIHAAGVSHDGLMTSYRRDLWHNTLRVNATGAFLVTRAALKYLLPGGRLVLLASRVGENGRAGQAAYAASKAAIISLAKTAAREAGDRRICVNALCPGFVPSAMTEQAVPAASMRQRRSSVTGEVGDAGQVVSAVRWLLSTQAEGVSGQVIHCDNRIL